MQCWTTDVEMALGRKLQFGGNKTLANHTYIQLYAAAIAGLKEAWAQEVSS